MQGSSSFDLEPNYTPSEIADWSRKSVPAILREIREGRLIGKRIGPVSIRIARSAALEWFERTSAQAPAACRNPKIHGKCPTGRPPRAKRGSRGAGR